MSDRDATTDGALEDLAYISRSVNRYVILRTVAERGYPRRELGEVTDTSRTTLGRILRELQDRGWCERTIDGEYAATPTGRLVVSEFTPAVEAMRTIRSLGDAAAWIPTEELSVGLRAFAGAEVRRAEPNAPLAIVDDLARLLRESSTFRVLTFLSPAPPIGETMYAGAVEGRLDVVGVLAGGLAEHLRDRDDADVDWCELVENGDPMYRYDGHIPCNLFAFDDVTLIMSDDPDGRTAVVEVEDDHVRAELDDLFDRYRDAAEELDASFFA